MLIVQRQADRRNRIIRGKSSLEKYILKILRWSFVLVILFFLGETHKLEGEDTDSEDEKSDKAKPEQNEPKEDKGKGKAEFNEDEEKKPDSEVLDYFYELLEQLKRLISIYEKVNQAYNNSPTEGNKSWYNEMKNQVDQLDDEIEDIKDQAGLAESEDESE